MGAEAFEAAYAHTAVVAGALHGDRPPTVDSDGTSPSGNHQIFYQWPAGELPEVTTTPEYQALLAAHAHPAKTPETVRAATEAFIQVANPFQAVDTARSLSEGLESDRVGFAKRMLDSIGFLAKFGLSEAGLQEEPPFEIAYRTVFHRDPELIAPIEVQAAQEAFREAMANAGVKIEGLSLADAFSAFKELPGMKMPHADVPAWVDAERARLRDCTARWVAPHMPMEALGLTMDDFYRTTLEYDAKPHGFHLYIGGETEGHPHFRGRLHIGLDSDGHTPVLIPSLIYLLPHEDVPGHHLDGVFRDAAVRKGLLPRESAIGIMHSSSIALVEGWAMTTPWLLTHSDPDATSPTLRTIAAHSYLTSIGRHDAGILRHMGQESPDHIGRKLLADYGFGPKAAQRTSNVDPSIFQSATYNPAYHLGIKAMRQAFERHGVQRTVQTVFGLGTPMDLCSFKQRTGL